MARCDWCEYHVYALGVDVTLGTAETSAAVSGAEIRNDCATGLLLGNATCGSRAAVRRKHGGGSRLTIEEREKCWEQESALPMFAAGRRAAVDGLAP